MARREDSRFVTGTGRYMDDIDHGDVLHVALHRSPYAHARIRSIGTRLAAAHPGVVRVITGEDAVRLTRPTRPRIDVAGDLAAYCLADRKVRFAGDPVVAVLARDRATAEDAAELVEVDYEVLPAVTDVEAAARADAPLVYDEMGTNVFWHKVLPYGDLDGAFAAADEIIQERFAIHRYASTPLETFGCVARYDGGTDSLTVWAHSQLPGGVIGGVANALAMPVSRIRFIQPDVGGAFGNKDRMAYVIICALLSKLSGRPVKFIEDRRESLTALAHACDGVMHVDAAVRRDGTILGMRFRNLENEGARFEFATIHNLLMLTNLVNCYRIPAVSYDGSSVLSHACPSGANRGVGKPFMAFAMERMVDRIARRLGLDPADVRFANFIQPDEFPYTTPSGNLYDPGDYPETLRRALARIGYKAIREEQCKAREQGRYLGIGIATTVEPSQANFGYSALINPKALMTGLGEAARIKVEHDGNVTVWTGATSTGQGHDTVIAQIVADELSLRPVDITVMPFDSATSPWLPTSGNYANKFSGTDTGAFLSAARKVRDKILSLAAQQLEAEPGDLELRDGTVVVRGMPTSARSIAEIVRPAYYGLSNRDPDFEPGVEAISYYANPLANLPDDQNRVRAQMNFANSAHVVVVEVDAETFEVRIIRYVVVHDVGRQLNPLIVEGQLHGSTIHGIAAALLEEFPYNEDGQLLAATFMDYLKPTAADVPNIESDHIETPSPFTPLGTKGAGEGGAIPAPAAVANAVEDALAPFGVTISRLPIKPSFLFASVTTAVNATLQPAGSR
jgi:2-furoyl-CoA dehydrogenase large subunit